MPGDVRKDSFLSEVMSSSDTFELMHVRIFSSWKHSFQEAAVQMLDCFWQQSVERCVRRVQMAKDSRAFLRHASGWGLSA